MKKILLLIAFGCSQSLWAQTLSPLEQKIVDAVNNKMAYAEALLKESVDINSGSLNIVGVKKVGDVFAREFTKAGLTPEWVPLPDSLRRAGHLVATRKGTKGKKLFLIGHLDTVFEPDMPPNPYKKLNDSTATGQGVNDMKGGDVVVIIALQVLEEMGLLKDATIVAYFTGDEERSGSPTSVSRKDFIERAKSCDIALGFEGASGLRNVATGRRGSSGWELKVAAKTGHSATIFTPNAGYGAIYEAARILNSFREELSTEKYLTFNPGIIVGGSEMSYNEKTAKGDAIGKTNIISPATVVTGDLRFLTEKQKIAAREKMTAITQRNLGGTTATIRFKDGIPAMEPTEGNDAIRAIISDVTVAMGLGPTVAGDPGSRGAGDISYVAKYLSGIDGLGASGKGAHAPGETINLKEFPLLIQRTALLIHRLIQP
ncbi:MAG: M20/M25/M40 family metallo-hydrolase [Chitinophagia bacterium]